MARLGLLPGGVGILGLVGSSLRGPAMVVVCHGRTSGSLGSQQTLVIGVTPPPGPGASGFYGGVGLSTLVVIVIVHLLVAVATFLWLLS
jgi:hypothetical protein